ncbi:hypothetical protein LOC54_00850 [Acetobacter sp. AN02]|nr:hypothetical protein [Acetobacter sp. AN02]
MISVAVCLIAGFALVVTPLAALMVNPGYDGNGVTLRVLLWIPVLGGAAMVVTGFLLLGRPLPMDNTTPDKDAF